ncbi:protein kinase domain-containing protein [Streptomyces thermoalcalitolerans]|uniref:non-specific serine/threonine protein kinase n=1 Tax=Streptomyces thermoalcalitolerans TaxID=65605 RepID=A0ABP4A4Y5_9ACTN
MVMPLDPAVDPSEAAGFRLLGRLGTGGFGTVYLGRRPGGGHGPDTLAAVKVLKREFTEDTQHMQRFVQESKALDRCRGARIPELLALDLGAGRQPTLATRFIPGLSLYRVVESHGGPLPRDTVHTLAAELVDTLTTAHRKGLLHRDLHPGNILLTRDGPWIIDFGLTRIRGQRVTLPLDMVIGHPHFCAPEQVRGLAGTGYATDVFGIAAVLLYALTGHPPYTAESDAGAMLTRRVTGVPPDVSGLPDDALGRLVRACLEEDPADRPHLDEVAEGLGRPGALRLPADVARTLAAYRAELRDFLAGAGDAADLTVPFRPGRRHWSAGVGEWPHSVVVTAEGDVVVADNSGAVRRLDGTTGEETAHRTGLTAPVRLHADGNVLLVCDSAGRLESWSTREHRMWWAVPPDGLGQARVVLRGQSVFLGDPDGLLHHFDAVTRCLWWRTGPLTGTSGTPAVPVAAGIRQVYLSAAQGMEILAVDDEDGALSWKTPVRLPAPVLAPPLPLEEHLVVADGDGTLRCLAAADGSTVWEKRLGAPVVAPPVRVVDTVIAGDTAGTVHCHSAATGEPRWRVHHGEREEFFTLCTDGAAVYAGGWSGRLHLLDAVDGASLQSFDLGGQILAAVCAPGGRSVHAASSGGTLHTLPSVAAPDAAAGPPSGGGRGPGGGGAAVTR